MSSKVFVDGLDGWNEVPNWKTLVGYSIVFALMLVIFELTLPSEPSTKISPAPQVTHCATLIPSATGEPNAALPA